MNPTNMQRASQLAGAVYNRLMQEVIEAHVLHERVGHALADKQKQEIKSGKAIDTRVIHLMSISGKGGWDEDPLKRERYLKNQNVTLLDHILSVVRGAVVLYALDTVASLQEEAIDEEFAKDLTATLTVAAAIAFLHDLDKMLQLPRDAELTLAQVESALQHYGIHAYLQQAGINLTAEQVRFLIEQAEDTQRYRHTASTPPPRAYKLAVERYVKLADKLDGLWQEHSSHDGLHKIIERLNKDQSLNSHLLTQWEALDIYDPHHPFLLDELQRRLSFACQRITGIPPLLETHQDGRLFVLLPKVQAASIKAKAIAAMLKHLPFPLTLRAPNKGTPAVFEIRNARPSYQELLDDFFYKEENLNILGKLFTVKSTLAKPLTPLLDECLTAIGLAPQWTKESQKTRQMYADPYKLSLHAREYFLQAALLALFLNLKVTAPKKVSVLDQNEREQELIALLVTPIPTWLVEIESGESRRVLLSLWVTALAHKKVELKAKVWGESGILAQWLEGANESTGFREYFPLDHEPIATAIELHLQQLLSKQRLHPVDESTTGRCLFTDFPTATLVNDNPDMYAVKASAFTGREGKPDFITAPPKGQTPISYVSVVEHKLRNSAFKYQGGKVDGVPTLISSPVTTGLFGALILNEDKDIQSISTFQLASKDKVKVHYKGLEAYKNRCRLARLELIPERLYDGEKKPGQVDTLQKMLNACLRIGRPIHIFRGLPTSQKAFFYFDAMPNVLKALLGFNEFRLEQIPQVLQQLQIAQTLIQTAGLGYDVLNLYAYPRTRFSAICLTWCFFRDNPSKKNDLLENKFISEFYSIQENYFMTEIDGSLVRLGQAANRIQRKPAPPPFNSTSEEMLVFNLCMDTAIGLRAAKQNDKASLIYGIAGELETNLVRKDKHRQLKEIDINCISFASQFVNEVWNTVLQGKPPAQKSRRLLGSIYRMAFLQSFHHNSKDAAPKSATEFV